MACGDFTCAASGEHPSSRACRGKPCLCPLGDELALELSERCEDAEGEAAVGSRGVDLRAGTRQHLQPDAAFAQHLGRDDQIVEVASKAIELPEDQCVAGLQCLQARGQARAGIVPTRREVFINPRGVDAGSEQRIALGRYLPHTASFHSNERIAPSNRGIKHLVGPRADDAVDFVQQALLQRGDRFEDAAVVEIDVDGDGVALAGADHVHREDYSGDCFVDSGHFNPP
jgi:hypothetical protein